jgi:hypothetical protein
VAITVADIRTQLPEFSSLTDAQIQLALDKANRRINTTAWGVKADDGLVCLTGHLLARSATEGQGAAGPISSESVGQVSVSYAISDSFKESDLGSTSYGRCFLELRKEVFPTRLACVT